MRRLGERSCCPGNSQSICRIGPGTAMGTAFRRSGCRRCRRRSCRRPIAIPGAFSCWARILSPTATAMARRMLYEVSPRHRGSASLALGRVEAAVFAASITAGGNSPWTAPVLETPNVADPTFKDRFKARAYPVREAGGLVWVYLGPPAQMPAFPRWPFFGSTAPLFPAGRRRRELQRRADSSRGWSIPPISPCCTPRRSRPPAASATWISPRRGSICSSTPRRASRPRKPTSASTTWRCAPGLRESGSTGTDGADRLVRAAMLHPQSQRRPVLRHRAGERHTERCSSMSGGTPTRRSARSRCAASSWSLSGSTRWRSTPTGLSLRHHIRPAGRCQQFSAGPRGPAEGATSAACQASPRRDGGRQHVLVARSATARRKSCR